jgi:hypothetical protein
LIIVWSDWTTDWKLGVAILVGLAIVGVSRGPHLNHHPPI